MLTPAVAWVGLDATGRPCGSHSRGPASSRGHRDREEDAGRQGLQLHGDRVSVWEDKLLGPGAPRAAGGAGVLNAAEPRT